MIHQVPVSEEQALREKNANSFPTPNPCSLSFGMAVNGAMSWCKTTTRDIDDCQLVETGKYFQRRFINKLPDLKGCGPSNSGLEVSSWPDRLAFILKATPESDLEHVGLKMKLTFPAAYTVLLE